MDHTLCCRSCKLWGLERILSLGGMPLANALLTEAQLAEPEPKYPLDVAFCPGCSLLQITETVPPEAIFCDYPYLSSFSEINVASARELTGQMMLAHGLDADSLVMEIGSNDGYLLQFYAEKGIPVLGIDPAKNIVQAAADRGVPTLCEFFGRELAADLVQTHTFADVIHINNTFAHIPDLNGLVAGLAMVLKDDGVIVIQVSSVEDMVNDTAFDSIYHEHLCYYSLTALHNLFHRHGLEVCGVRHLPIHCGTLRVFVRKATAEGPPESVHGILRRERTLGVTKLPFYQDFGSRVDRLREHLVRMLDIITAEGKSIVGYGAAAKGATLLNYCGIGPGTLDYVVDHSTMKQGRYTPGSHLLIEPPAKLLETMPDYALLLAWNCAEQILARETEYLRSGGRFIIPVPEPKVCTWGG